jgi:hypothetical protein
MMWRRVCAGITAVTLGWLGLLALTPGRASAGQPPPAAFVQGATLSVGPPVGPMATSGTMTFTNVKSGDLLVGWFSQFNAPGQVQVSDDVNGGWTRAPGALAFEADTGDIALYYVSSSKAALTLNLTVRASAGTSLTATAAEYSGLAIAGPLDQLSSARGSTGPTPPPPPAVAPALTVASSGSTPNSVPAGELVYTSLITGSAPGTVTPGSSGGQTFVQRAAAASNNAWEGDILSATAGNQQASATLGNEPSPDWYMVVATFRVYPTGDTTAPAPPSNLQSASAATSRVALSWTASPTPDVTGYTVYRNGLPIGLAASDQTTFLDTTPQPSTTYVYTIDSFDGAGLHSGRVGPVTVKTPVLSPRFVQGNAGSTGIRVATVTLTLTQPVGAGDLLVGWFAQYNAPGQVTVSDNVNGLWTRGVSTTFTDGLGDIAMESVVSKAAPSGLAVTMTAPGGIGNPSYLQEAFGEYSGVNTATPLLQPYIDVITSPPTGTMPISSSWTANVPANDLLLTSTLTAGQPGSATPGSSRNVPYVMDVANGSASASMEDILATAAGPQTGALTLGAGSTAYVLMAAFAPVMPPPPPPPPPQGYWLASTDGRIFTYGAAVFHGSTGNITLTQPIVGMEPTTTGKGYWLVASDGGVFSFGDARFYGSTGNLRLTKPVVGMEATKDGKGYWLVASDGGVFSFGDAAFHGSTGNLRLVKPVLGMARTPSGNGYWLVASDGGIFSFGDAVFHGSTGNLRLTKPIVGMATTLTGNGYWLVASDGGIFSFGQTVFHGSAGNLRLANPIVGMATTPSGNGYWLVGSDGNIFSYGDAVSHGSAGNLRLAKPIVAIASIG